MILRSVYVISSCRKVKHLKMILSMTQVDLKMNQRGRERQAVMMVMVNARNAAPNTRASMCLSLYYVGFLSIDFL